MTITTLKLVETPTGHDIWADDDDTWVECCLHCGTLDNRGDNLCVDCDDLAA